MEETEGRRVRTPAGNMSVEPLLDELRTELAAIGRSFTGKREQVRP